MKAKMDFSGVNTFELLPQGEYTCYAFDVDLRQTRNGDDMYVLILKVAEGEHKGRQLFYNLPVMKQTMWKIKETLETFGLEIPESVVEVDFDEILGKKCIAVVEHRVAKEGKRKGETVETVEDIRPFEGEEQEVSKDQTNKDVPF